MTTFHGNYFAPRTTSKVYANISPKSPLEMQNKQKKRETEPSLCRTCLFWVVIAKSQPARDGDLVKLVPKMPATKDIASEAAS